MRKLEIIRNFFSLNYNYIKQLWRDRRIHKNIKKYDAFHLPKTVHRQARPCFVLSTGRCGTKLLTRILNKHGHILAYHNPSPEFTYHSKLAYELRGANEEMIKQIADAGRYEYIRDAFLSNYTFVETNNRVTFFANEFSEIYPNARFIHLVRHPLSFIISGLSRNWYSGKVLYDEGRIRPGHSDGVDWSLLDQAQKIAWLWNETNQFIEEFKDSIETERIITVKSEDLFSQFEVSIRIFHYLDLEPIKKYQIEKLIGKRINKGGGSDSILNKQREELMKLTPLFKKYYRSFNPEKV